jgi:hypothetical protein
MLVGISTPYRRSGLLYSKFKRHFGKTDDDVLVIRAPTRLLNPTIPQSVVDAALVEDPAAARAEWLAEFRDDIAGWLATEVIEDAVDNGVIVRPPLTNIQYTGFVDPSGGARASYTCAVAHLEEDEIAVLDCLLEIKPPFNPASATKQIADLLRSYGLQDCIGDRYGATWVTSEFDRCGIWYKHSTRDRSAIYADTLPLFTSGRARLLDNRRLVSQFSALERKTSSMGKDRIDHGPGGHDDLCNAAAGALVNAVLGPQNCWTDVTEEVWGHAPALVDAFGAVDRRNTAFAPQLFSQMSPAPRDRVRLYRARIELGSPIASSHNAIRGRHGFGAHVGLPAAISRRAARLGRPEGGQQRGCEP